MSTIFGFARPSSRFATGSVYDTAGSHALDLAREGAFGEGLTQRRKSRFCVKCQQDVDPKGGKEVGPMYLCAGCRSKGTA